MDTAHRDLDGVLWEQCAGQRRGRPAYAERLHPQRQREAMECLRCAVCGGPADRSAAGMLWLLPLEDEAGSGRWEGALTSIPPMRGKDAQLAASYCPRLRDGHVVLRVRRAELVGVRGTLYPPPGVPERPEHDALVLYASSQARFVVAREAVRRFSKVSVARVVPGRERTARRGG